MFKCQSFLIILLLLLLLIPMISISNNDNAKINQPENIESIISSQIILLKMKKKLDFIKNCISKKTNEKQLSKFNHIISTISDHAYGLFHILISQSYQLNTELNNLSNKRNSNKEKYLEIMRKHNMLIDKKIKINSQLKNVSNITNNAILISDKIILSQSPQFKNQLTFNSGNILSTNFWSSLLNYSTDNQTNDFFTELKRTFILAWNPRWRIVTILWLFTAIIVIIFGSFYMEKYLFWISINKISEGRLRRSFFSTGIMLSTLCTTVLNFKLISLAFNRREEVPVNIQDFFDHITQLSGYYGLFKGLSRAFLFTKHPSWRLIKFPKELIKILKPLIAIVTILVLIFQSIEAFHYSIHTVFNSIILTNILISMLIGSTGIVIGIRIHPFRHTILKSEKKETCSHSQLFDVIQIFITTTSITILILTIIGYITLASFLSYEMIWCCILVGIYHLLSNLIDDICESFFLRKYSRKKWKTISSNIEVRDLQKLATLLKALGQTILVFFIIIQLLTTTFLSSMPINIIKKINDFLLKKGLESLDIVFMHILSTIFCVLIGIYILRVSRCWLEEEFLPKTSMDVGTRVSLVTLFSNIGYIIIMLLAVSIMGLQWNKLAWIVSALSVGIGFGLQEIVKNFISGLILLTEHPVKVGDLVSIGGIEGDIRRINVRATEIQLSDKSTLIVPNAQLISQNVRNITMDNAQGVVIIPLTFPLDVDLILVREILLSVYDKNKRILKIPKPSVSFKDLVPNGILLSVTGYVSNHRQISITKSDLIFNILTQLRKEKISLSTSQSIILKHNVSTMHKNSKSFNKNNQSLIEK